MDITIFSGQSNMQGQCECLSENNIVNDAYEYKWLTDEMLPLKNPVGENITYSMGKGDDVTHETNIPSWLENTHWELLATETPIWFRAFAERIQRTHKDRLLRAYGKRKHKHIRVVAGKPNLSCNGTKSASGYTKGNT